jgi:2-alkenal reductase
VKKNGLYKLIAIVALALLLVTACAPALGPADRAGDTKNPTKSLVSLVGEQKRDAADEIVPVTNAEAPVAEIVGDGAMSAEAVSLQETLTQLYRTANPSVVYIIVSSGNTESGFPMGGGSGSGFVYSNEGYIVTNNHVVDAGETFEIVYANGDRQFADLVGKDPDSDLAVLQVEALPEGVRPLPLGDGDRIEVGQFAVAIGNPFGEQGSMSMGIISGLGRSLPSQRSTGNFGGSTYSLPQVIQTDAPINPGNSGGPLLNLDGEVIGVNAAIATTSGSNSGVGFSIPVDVVKRVVPSLIENGEMAYAYMGVSFDGEITLADQELYGLSQTRGAYVITVTPGSPADEAGLIGADAETGQGGDLIIALDGLPINDFSDLNTYLVLETEVGQTIEMTVVRDGETLSLPLTLGARP